MQTALRTALPRTYNAQLATLVKSPPVGEAWLHEIKLDGYRIGCRKDGDEVTLISRNGKDWTARFPEIAGAARTLEARQALLDGEVVMLQPDGRTSSEVVFSEWTDEGKIRHPSFQGLRSDKRPRDVTIETPQPAQSQPVAPKARADLAGARVDPSARRRASRQRVDVAGVSLSHPERMMFPEAGVTKLALARFYDTKQKLSGKVMDAVRAR